MFYCEQDTLFEPVQEWRRFAIEEPEFNELGYSHFFFHTETEKFCKIIQKKLNA